MANRCRSFCCRSFLLLVYSLAVVVLSSPVISGISDTLFKINSGASTVQKDVDGFKRLKDCQDCYNKKANGFWGESLDEDTNHDASDENEDRKLWKLGSLPPGLITFYNLTYPLDRCWHVLGLGYDPAVNLSEIENAAVIHYNGNYKPWLDLAITKYKSYWSKFVNSDDHYIQLCSLIQ